MQKIKFAYDPYLKKDVFKIKYDSDELPKLQLFNSADVVLGNPSSNIVVAFIYTWKSDKAPAKINDFLLRLSNYCAITGYWRTTNGAKYVFANILANPNINKLVLVVFDSADNGHMLVECLTKFWENGVDKDEIVIGSRSPNPKFEQVDKKALDRVKKQVDLIVLDNQKNFSSEEPIKQCYQEPKDAVDAGKIKFFSLYTDKIYDTGARFDEPYYLNLTDTAKNVHFIEKKLRPSLGESIQAENLSEAQDFIAGFVFKNGTCLKDQRNIMTLECRSLSVTILDPLAKIPEGFSMEYLEKYADEFMHGAPGDEFAYTYHQRIFKKWGNQVERAIAQLKKSPQSRRNVISLWDPKSDLESPSPPCLNMIALEVRDNFLELHVLYRSHHLATVTRDGRLLKGEGAFVPNIYALAKLQNYIAAEARIKPGAIILTDFSGHLYVSSI